MQTRLVGCRKVADGSAVPSKFKTSRTTVNSQPSTLIKNQVDNQLPNARDVASCVLRGRFARPGPDTEFIGSVRNIDRDIMLSYLLHSAAPLITPSVLHSCYGEFLNLYISGTRRPRPGLPDW